MITIDADFENGSLGRTTEISENWYHIGLRPDTAYWTHFRIRGCKGREITFTLTFLERAHTNRWGTRETGNPENPDPRCRNPYLSYDGKEWQHFDFAEKYVTMPNTVYFRHAFEEDEAYVCYTIPYTYSNLKAYLKRIESHPLVTVESLGKTKNGNNEPLVSITANDRSRDLIMLICREDSDEPTSNVALEGLINRLISGGNKDAEDILNRYKFKIVPMVAIDAVVAGTPYGGPYGVMARRWLDEPALPGIENIRRVIKSWFEKYRIRLIGKMHGGQTYDNPPVWDFRVLDLKLRKLIPEGLPEKLDEVWNPFLLDAVPWVRKLKIFETYLQRKYDFWNFFSTHTNGKDPYNLRQQGELFADLLVEYCKTTGATAA